MNSVMRLLFVAGCALATVNATGAGLQVSNRAPRPDEVGYRPPDGAGSALNPPSWIWLHEPAAHRYTVQWAQDPDFTRAEWVGDVPWNTYTHHEALAPGTWFWRYRFVTSDGRESGWSQSRRVIVAPDAKVFPMPTVVQQRERVPKAHPRLFLRPEDLPRLRQLAAGGEAARFNKIRTEADRFIQAGPTPEPSHLGSARDKEDKELIRYWWPNRVQTMQACQEAETIAFVYLMNGEPKYAEAARRWILHLAGWNPDGPTNFKLNCEAAKPLLYRLPRAYDWAYHALAEADRNVVRQAMRRRAQDAWQSGEVRQGVGHLNQPFSSHGNRTWHKLGECGIAFLGEVPEAETWLDYAVNKFHACYPVWADEDGGWHEGVSYWAGYMSKAVWWLQAAQAALKIDGLQKPFFDHVGDFPLYVAPPGSPNAGFGDLSHNRPSAGWGGFLEYFMRAQGGRPEPSHAAYWRWWSEQWQMREQEGILGFLYAANLPSLPDAKPPEDLPPSKVFRGIGVASLHTTLLDSRDDVHLLFKSSPFGTQSHGHNPHNSFQVNAYGEALLTTCVYRDLHGSKFHYQWAHSTRAHNAVLVDGRGQTMHSPAPHGRIVDSRFTSKWDYVVGDATAAYGDRLTRYHRHVVFVKPDVIVFYDDLAAAEPHAYQFMLHALAPFRVDAESARLVVEQPKAGAAVQYLSPVPLQMRQWDGYDPKPDREFPNQWHVEAGTQGRHAALGMLTVLVVYRPGASSEWTVGRVETDSALGLRFLQAGRVLRIAFRKDGVKGPASVDGETFDGPVLVR